MCDTSHLTEYSLPLSAEESTTISTKKQTCLQFDLKLSVMNLIIKLIEPHYIVKQTLQTEEGCVLKLLQTEMPILKREKRDNASTKKRQDSGSLVYLIITPLVP